MKALPKDYTPDDHEQSNTSDMEEKSLPGQQPLPSGQGMTQNFF